jgi:quercetin dioxygenase-like cupin family protein
MISLASKAIPSLVIGFTVVAVSTHLAAQQHQPMTITRLYTGSDGQTHEENMEVKFSPTTLYPKAEASEAVKVSEAQFFRLPKGEVQNWHKPAHRQYVVTLSGRGEVEIAGGQKILLSPGRVLLLENVTGKGHITRSTGSEDLTFFIVPLAAR